MYIVHNLTTKTVILGDLKVEIGPRKILDLEKVAHRDIIDRSYNLRHALDNGQLRLVKYSVVKTHAQQTEVSEKIRIVETDKLDDNRLRDLIRQTITEEIGKTHTNDVEGTIKRVISSSVMDLRDSIRDQINTLTVPGRIIDKTSEEEQFIDPAKLAEMQQKSIKKMTEEIETGGKQEGKKINIKNSNIRDLASDL